jgi:hypothetical protein
MHSKQSVQLLVLFSSWQRSNFVNKNGFIEPLWLANAYWVVSVNDNTAPAPFREPSPRINPDFSSRKRFQPIVLAQKSGYRIRYPLVAVPTNCSGTREDGRPLETGNPNAMGIKMRQIR